MSHDNNSRRITQRIVIKGNLVLQTPANLGNGDAEGLTDMPLSLDKISGRPLLTGSSIAGALRYYLNIYTQGYANARENKLTTLLFGGSKQDDEGEQSSLIIHDSIADESSYHPEHIEIRDGVKIDYTSRTAEDRKKYDFELIPAGTMFPLQFELLLSDDEHTTNVKEALVLALNGFTSGEIGLGARKTRGFGACTVDTWYTTVYDLKTTEGLLAWLSSEHTDWGYAQPENQTGSLKDVLGVSQTRNDRRQTFTIDATFTLNTPILIRSNDPLNIGQYQPDTTHIGQWREGKKHSIIPGTSLAGVLRSRADRILNTFNSTKTRGFLNQLFGTEMEKGKKPAQASRLMVQESNINEGHTMVQNRVGIDRFTGGALDSALFNEAPHIGGHVSFHILIQEPREAEIGLLLLLLKDLWTGDVPIGGTSSVGRGRLKGKRATICYSNERKWEIQSTDTENPGLTVTGEDAQNLEVFVAALHNELEAI
jgi:CRISPR/Cas system CSM-associated protein Csm3 (group 7 of RAMP superfamily)